MYLPNVAIWHLLVACIQELGAKGSTTDTTIISEILGSDRCWFDENFQHTDSQGRVRELSAKPVGAAPGGVTGPNNPKLFAGNY